MFRLSALPHLTFLTRDSDQRLDLPQCGAQIRRIAELAAARTPAKATVGLVAQTGPELVLAWLGVVASGRVPLILQYPNDKISKQYWSASLRDTVERCGVAALICSAEIAAHEPQKFAPAIFFNEIDWSADGPAEVEFPTSGHILQLSSGTTGFKKPIRFEFSALREHAQRYNQVLGLTATDCIASWLPLYHDMGYIACFVTPLLLGVPVVMMDPMTWVRQPEMLYRAIERFAGTVCYMPNFGFEVMSRLGKSGPFPTMRHWVSCSEPTYAATLEKFISATDADPATVSTCYGMAENVFAVAQSAGFRTFERDGQRHVSCGRPIPGTEIEPSHEQLWVRSPHSLQRYEGGEDLRDRNGFYPTGDIGFLEDGEIVVTGRKQDLANIGGRKYLLNDWDFLLGTLFPLSAGRIASLSFFDPASGTEKALFLIEAPNFWEWNASPEPARMIRAATGVEWMEVHFVPPQFLTKTSSGKINRQRTLADWQSCRDSVRFDPGTAAKADPVAELRAQFPALAPNRPALEQVDSLGQLILRMFCEEHGIAVTPGLTLNDIAQLKKQTKTNSQADDDPGSQVFSIVALVDGARLGLGAAKPAIDEAFLEALAEAAGCPVRFEHICAPPAPILFSDLTFHDYFLPRNPDPAYAPFSATIEKIKRASLILVDDEDNFRTPPYCVYPVLDHRFTKHDEAEFLGHRMQRYTENHHLLPRRILAGREIAPANIGPTLKNLESYLGVPIFKMAFHEAFRQFTEPWEFCAYQNASRGWLAPFCKALTRFIRQRRGQFRLQAGEPANRLILLDPPHFCSFLLNRMAVDFVTRIYSSFCIVGRPSSLPYLTRRLDELGKPYFFSSQIAPDRDDYECLLLTGGVGGYMPETSKPTFDFVHARKDDTGGGHPHNVAPEIDYVCPPFAVCDEQIFRQIRPTHGVLIGNFLLNHTAPASKS